MTMDSDLLIVLMVVLSLLDQIFALDTLGPPTYMETPILVNKPSLMVDFPSVRPETLVGLVFNQGPVEISGVEEPNVNTTDFYDKFFFIEGTSFDASKAFNLSSIVGESRKLTSNAILLYNDLGRFETTHYGSFLLSVQREHTKNETESKPQRLAEILRFNERRAFKKPEKPDQIPELTQYQIREFLWVIIWPLLFFLVCCTCILSVIYAKCIKRKPQTTLVTTDDDGMVNIPLT